MKLVASVEQSCTGNDYEADRDYWYQLIYARGVDVRYAIELTFSSAMAAVVFMENTSLQTTPEIEGLTLKYRFHTGLVAYVLISEAIGSSVAKVALAWYTQVEE